MRQVSANTFQLILRPGSVAGTRGIASAVSSPRIASPIVAAATYVAPCPGRFMSTPASKVPARIATNVPISTSPLPPTISASRSTCGRMEYLSGPNSVECRPIRNSATSSAGMLRVVKPAAATTMIATSSSLMKRASRALSNFSASWPAVAENRKNGRMNSAAARLVSPFCCATVNVVW